MAGIGWTAPVLLVTLRLLQGLALGGEYGGAATYVAEHARPGERGYATSWIQTTATLGFFLSLVRDRRLPVLSVRCQGLCRVGLARAVPGLSLPLDLLRLHSLEAQRVADLGEDERGGQRVQTAAYQFLLQIPNNKYVLLALLGATAGQGVVWYTGQFYALFFLTITLKVDLLLAYMMVGGLAADRYAILRVLRLAERQDRPTEDHSGRAA